MSPHKVYYKNDRKVVILFAKQSIHVRSHPSLIFKSVYCRYKFIFEWTKWTNKMYRLDDQGSTPSRGRDVSVCHYIQTTFGANRAFCLVSG